MQTQNDQIHLHEKLLRLVKLERRITSKLLDLLQEVENNKFYLAWGYSNLFEYLVRGLNYSEALAYQRKSALKICQAIPEVKEKLDRGSISLTTLAHKPTREVDKILAREWSFTTPDESKTPGPAKRYVNDSTVRITLDFSEEEFASLERLKSHQAADLKNHLFQKQNTSVNTRVRAESLFAIDHIKSVSKGGGNDTSNLQVLCQAHNQFKYLKQG